MGPRGAHGGPRGMGLKDPGPRDPRAYGPGAYGPGAQGGPGLKEPLKAKKNRFGGPPCPAPPGKVAL